MGLFDRLYDFVTFHNRSDPGYASYQLAKNGAAKLKTTLNGK
ncbi:hypothetical protein FHX14_002918 [Rhizobium sp. BK619]|nr:hypothetical protein [Rhizobium sp. BK619]